MKQPAYPCDKDIGHGDDECARTERDRDDPAQPCAGQAFDDCDSWATLAQRVVSLSTATCAPHC
jgi:hypothetical protein